MVSCLGNHNGVLEEVSWQVARGNSPQACQSALNSFLGTGVRPELAGAPDELAAMPRRMAELGLTGVLFTADALHCHKDGFAQAGDVSPNSRKFRQAKSSPATTASRSIAGHCRESPVVGRLD